MASSPLTKPPDSSVEYSLASSTASEITTLVGTSSAPSELERGHPQHRPVDHRHPVERPVDGVLGDELVDAGLVVLHSPGQLRGIGLGGHRQLVQHRAHALALQVGLVEQLERPFPRAPPAPQREQF